MHLGSGQLGEVLMVKGSTLPGMWWMQDQGGQDGQQLQASMAQAALMHQMQTQYQSYIQQCVQAQQTPSPTPGQEQLQQLLQQQLQPPRQSTPSLPHSASSPILAPPEEQ